MAGSACVSDDELVALATGTADRSARQTIEAHCVECADCRGALTTLLRLESGAQTSTPQPGDVVKEILHDAVRATLGLDRFGPGHQIDRYVLLDPIGVGAMGVVFVAWDPTLRRKVALKLVRGATTDLSSRKRLVREAQTLARLRHSNVVAVYDAGVLEDVAFVTMEYVEGMTLAAWLAEEPRSLKSIVDVFVAAGRGLAAAHVAGIIHRDFKPANVFVDVDGRTLVGDFGLARSSQRSEERQTEWLERAPGGDDTTESSHFGGTPAYSAPECRAGATADASSDQYSYCVALHEAIFKHRPDSASRSANQPAAREIPRRIRRVLQRGLSSAPAARYESMSALVEALATTRTRLWLNLAVAGVLILLAVGATAAWMKPPALCNGRAPLDRFWSSARQHQVQRAFEAARLPYSNATWLAISSWLSRYRSELDAAEQSVCHAGGRDKKERELLTMQLSCLDSRAESADELTKLFADADASVVERASLATAALRPIADCRDTELLRAAPAAPSNEQQRHAVEQLRRKLARAASLRAVGRPREARPLAEAVAADPVTRAYAPLDAESSLEAGLDAIATDNAAAAGEKWLTQAVDAGTAVRSDYVVAMAAIYLIQLNTIQRPNIAAAQFWDRFAESAVRRMNDDPLLLAGLLMERGALRYNVNGGGIEEYRQAYVLRRTRLGDHHPLVAASLFRIGEALAIKMANSSEAVSYLRQALSIEDSAVGAEHPATAAIRCALSVSLERAGQYAEASDAARRCVSVYERLFAPDSTRTATALTTLANALVDEGKAQEAVGYLRKAIDIEGRFPDERRAYLIDSWLMLGRAYWEQRDLAKSADAFRHGLALAPLQSGANIATRAFAQDMLARTMRASGLVEAAIAQHRVALRTAEQADLSDRGCTVGQVYRQLAIDHLAARQYEPARTSIETALRECANDKMDPDDRAEALFARARILAGLGESSTRVIAMAEDASKLYASLGGHYQDRPRVITRWIGQLRAGVKVPEEVSFSN